LTKRKEKGHAVERKGREASHQVGEHSQETAPVDARSERSTEEGRIGSLGDQAGERRGGGYDKGLGWDKRFVGLNEKTLTEALVACRGDILQTAKYLKFSVRELDNLLRAIPGSAAVLGTIEQVKAENPEWERASTAWFEQQCRRAMSLYRLTAMEELYALATMDLSENAAMMNVKREAALNLLGRDRDGSEVFPELSAFFKGLNEEYQQKSVRITEVRARLIEVQSGTKEAKALEVIPQSE
jgi:hypothetical protein